MKKYDLSILPTGNAPDHLEYPHFPTLHQLVIWRNIGLVPAERIAETLETSAEKVIQCAQEMGLDTDESTAALFLERGFQTIIRRNWDILPYEQILDLLQWTPEYLAYILKEDDFLWVKLGFGKPRCAPVKYRELSSDEKIATRKIKAAVEKYFPEDVPQKEKPFDFLKHYGRKKDISSSAGSDGIRMVYSYSALYGDPLLDPEIGSYPEEMLADYAACGINAVWLQATLYTLVPYFGEKFPGSARWQERLANLKKLVDRGKKYGIDIILYLNEPRAMAPDFFEHTNFRMGARQRGFDDRAICCSDPKTLAALEDAVYRMFKSVPGLGGVMTITMSENLTHCKSREEIDIPCPHCADIPAPELVLKVNTAVANGMRRAAPDAKFIVYTWAWQRDGNWADKVIAALPRGSYIMSVSETGVETDCGGIKGSVKDYSISKPGPGKYAAEQWKCALDHGHRPMAKVQINHTWELSAVPFIPAADLVQEHLERLRTSGVKDYMLCWTLGGFPGGNLELVNIPKEELAKKRFGRAAEQVLSAWSCFSRAFAEFPFNGIEGLYSFPGNYGPMSLLHLKHTFRKASMIGFPYDDLYSWRGEGHYPESIYREAFSKLCTKWKQGIDELEKTAAHVQPEHRDSFDELCNISNCCYCHFKSVLNQIDFIRLRRENRPYRTIAEDEISLAVKEWELMRQDSRIGYEASNHYFFVSNDLKEKVINCLHLIGQEENNCR